MIYLMRHGETVWNTERRMQGRLDSPLTARGIAQAQALGSFLSQRPEAPDHHRIVSSPLGRAWQTAVIVAGELGMPPPDIAFDERLAELAYGQWEGMTVDEIEARHPEAWAVRDADRWNVAPPGGENYAAVAKRAGSWLSDIAEDDSLIVVCHGVTSRVLRGLYAGLPTDETVDLTQPQDRLFRLHRGCVEELGPADRL